MVHTFTNLFIFKGKNLAHKLYIIMAIFSIIILTNLILNLLLAVFFNFLGLIFNLQF